jgi:hypothetical protein
LFGAEAIGGGDVDYVPVFTYEFGLFVGSCSGAPYQRQLQSTVAKVSAVGTYDEDYVDPSPVEGRAGDVNVPVDNGQVGPILLSKFIIDGQIHRYYL